MLIEPMIQQLHQLRLRGMATGLEQLLSGEQHASLSFEERLSVMIQHEIIDRDSKRLAQRLRWAKLPQNAALEDLDTRTPRGVDPKLIAMLAAFTWIKEKLNVLITGPCGVGKSFIASALAHAACRADYSVRSFRLPRLIEELTRHHAQANRSAFLKQLAKVDLLYIDDFGLTPLADQSSATCWRSSRIATTRSPRSSRVNFPSTSGTPTSTNQRSPTRSSTGSCTTAIASRSRAALCANTNATPSSLRVDDNPNIHHSHATLATRPTCAGIDGRHQPESLADIGGIRT
jgi:DNA replication protein DnaC